MFFAATGIADGDLLKGVHYRGDGASTESLVMRAKSGTIRTIHSEHRWQKLMPVLGGEVRLRPRATGPC